MAASDDVFRKPSTEAWQCTTSQTLSFLFIPASPFRSSGYFIVLFVDFVSKLNNNVTPNLKECMYVGDAGGRLAGWKAAKKKVSSAYY